MKDGVRWSGGMEWLGFSGAGGNGGNGMVEMDLERCSGEG